MSHTPFASVGSESGQEEHDAFLAEFKSPSSSSSFGPRRTSLFSWRTLLVVVPWLISASLGVWVLVLQHQLKNNTTAHGSYESGFDTDLIPSSRIPTEQIRFRGSPHFDANGTGYLDPVDKTAPWPENMALFGPPSSEIDDNWERLIGDRYFAISEEEATRAWGEKRHEYVDERKGGYSAGLDVFHTLHCVNALREALHPEYYPSHHSHGPFHLEHCLDAIRQSIQCYGSTTLIPTKFREGLEHNYIDSDQVHTCRSFTYLREFVTSRKSHHENYAGRNKSLRDPRKHAIAKAWKARQRHGRYSNYTASGNSTHD